MKTSKDVAFYYGQQFIFVAIVEDIATMRPIRYFENRVKRKEVRPINPLPNKPWIFTCLQYKSFENTVGKGEISRYEQFLLFQQCFLTHFHQT